MPPKESSADGARAWLAKANSDLMAAEVLLKSKIPFQPQQVLFHCQQAAEKSLKAFLVWKEVTFHWTHYEGSSGASV